ncbi:MAG TPA: glycosyltransferase [Chryseolinea sp.]|nr:glycosyltransferase [Chryseolinea sp.]
MLELFASHTIRWDYEIIVVGDGSQDQTQEMLSKIYGIRVFRNESNLVFIASSNRGAKQARGEYLVFLNNDTVVTPNWLDALLDTFKSRPDAGLVGAKLRYTGEQCWMTYN